MGGAGLYGDCILQRDKKTPVIKPEKRVEKRSSTLRRQVNQSFCDEYGNVIVTKVIAVMGQTMLLYFTARYFGDMLYTPETMLVCLSFIIAPDLVKKVISMKYGNGHGVVK